MIFKLKNITKTGLFVSVFSLYSSFASFAMEACDVDIGGNTCQKLRNIPEVNFRRSHIRLRNITSNKKFFDDQKGGQYKSSIAYKLLKAIADDCVQRIEYDFTAEEKSINRVQEFMTCIARGQKIATKCSGKDTFELRDSYEVSERISSLQYGDNTKSSLNYGPKYTKFIEMNKRIMVIENRNLHWATNIWVENERISERQRIIEAENNRREDDDDILEALGARGLALARGYDANFDR